MANYRGMNQDYMRRPGYGNNHMPPQTRPMPASPCCPNKQDAINNMPLAMAYIPWQTWQCLYDARKGFQRGTIFEELDKPFRGIGGCCR